MMIREKWLGLVLIPFINTINYYLTYSSMSPTPFFLLTYGIDTVQGWITWYAGRAAVMKLDAWYPYSQGILKRILLQILLTSMVMLSLIIAMTELAAAIAGRRPIPLSFYTENLVIFFIWILVFNGIYVGIHFYRGLTEKPEPQPAPRISARLGKQQVLLEQTDVLYFNSEGDLTTALDRRGKTYYLDTSLRQLEKDLSGRFFRANRQYLLSRTAVRRFQPGVNGKLRVWIGSPDETEQEITVSRTKAPGFRKWVKG